MAVLIRNAYVFAPQEIGPADVLMTDEKITAVGKDLSVSLPNLSVIDASGFILAPGFIDQHVHLLGGGGVGGPATRAPAVAATELIAAGITSVVGVLGADVMTRGLPDLLAKVRELKSLGLSAWMYTSSFKYPPVTLTRSIADDVALIGEVLGVKLALGDANGSFPSSTSVLEMLTQIRQAACTVGKQGLLHVHLGYIPNPFGIFEEIAATGFPIGEHLRPTHCGRTEFLLKSACAYAMHGKDRYIDITTDGPCYLGHPAAAVSTAVSAGVPVEQITLSSDGHGVVPRFNAENRLIGQAIGEVSRNHRTMVELIRDYSFPVQAALSLITSNVADALGLPDQGRIAENACANAVLLDQELNIRTVISRGKIAMHNGKCYIKNFLVNE